MNFNRGYICKDHGPMEKAITKNKRFVCPLCTKDVKPWEKPLEERPGRCSFCTGASFKLAVYKHDILRCCKNCKEVYNVDKEKILKKGELVK